MSATETEKLDGPKADDEQMTGLYMELHVDDIHVKDRYAVTAVGEASGGRGYRAVATSDGQIHFFVGTRGGPWSRIPFLDFTVGKESFVQFVAIGGDCSGNSHPSLLAYGGDSCAHAFEWHEKEKRWRRIGVLEAPSRGWATAGWYRNGVRISRVQWEENQDGARGWSLYAGGSGHLRLRRRRWYELWHSRWVLVRL